MSHVMNTYVRQPVAFVRGEGVWLWDEEGRKYLDALAGIAVNTLGYGHPKLNAALARRIQSGVLHTSNLWRIPDQEAAADRIAASGDLPTFGAGCAGSDVAQRLLHPRSDGQPRGVRRLR